MANLDAIVKEIKRGRDRLDAAINALTSLSGNTLRARKGRTMSAAARRRIAAARKIEMGEAEEGLEDCD
jgi:exonuclease VII small subunit